MSNPDEQHLKEYNNYLGRLERGEVNITKDQADHRIAAVKNCIEIVNKRVAETTK